MKALILGGTTFVGVHLTAELLERGHEVVHFNRGRARPDGVPGARSVRGDRTQGFAALEDERFDAVIDTSGYLPHVVERSARFFSGRTARYVFISTISVYDTAVPELFEDSPMPALPPGASHTLVTPETYGPLKAACERLVASALRHRATIVRPGLIVGPNDPTDRFTYWPLRFERGGRVLAPGTPLRGVQFVDARDLAAFVAHLLERDAGGDYSVTSPQRLFSMGDVTDACARAARVPSRVRWVDDEFLLERGVKPWMDLPLWVPPSQGMPGLLNVNVTRASTAGFRVRPLRETVRDTLAWALRRPRGTPLAAGLSVEREQELLAAID